VPPKPRPGSKPPSRPTVAELKAELARTREQLVQCQKEREGLTTQLKELQDRHNETERALAGCQAELDATRRDRDRLVEQLKGLQDKYDKTQKELAACQAELAATQRERDNLLEQLKASQQKIDDQQKQLLTQQEELGRLREVASAVDSLRAERDALRAELDQTRSAIPDQVKNQVRTQLVDATQAHTDEVSALQSERDRLQARVEELEQGSGAADAPSMTTADLAGHFAGVLNDLGNRPPAVGEAFAAALTGLNVQAKGLLRANDQGEVEIMTADAGAVPAEQLSTVGMELKLLPRLAAPPANEPPS
jgi:uncharacterized phage infection (PIP) family protein YhgE